MFQDHDRQRHHQMQCPVSDVSCIPGTVSATARQQFQIYRKNQNQYQRNPEFRNTAGYGPQLTENPVCHLIFLPGTHNSQQQRTCKYTQKSDSSQQQGISDPSPNDFCYILLIFKRNSKISVQGIFYPFYILHRYRLIQPQLFHSPFPFFRTHFF